MEINPFAPPRSVDLEPAAAGDERFVDAEGVREIVKTVPWARRCAWLASAVAVLGAVSAAVAMARWEDGRALRLALGLVTIAAALWFRSVFVAYARHGLALAVGDARGLEGVLRAQRAFFRGLGVLFLASIAVGVVAGSWAARAGG